jgi:cytochrome c556
MKRVLIAAAAVAAIGTTAVFAADSPAIKQRKEILKSFGAATKDPGAMNRGEAAFDLAKVQAALKVYQSGAPKLKGLFPADSKTGGETQALPVIWEKKKEFDGLWDKLAADASAAAGKIKDEASFKAEFPKVLANCGGCHKVYRVPPKK